MSSITLLSILFSISDGDFGAAAAGLIKIALLLSTGFFSKMTSESTPVMALSMLEVESDSNLTLIGLCP